MLTLDLLQSSQASWPTKTSRVKAKTTRWSPLPGPQTMALYSDADELFYGGAGGGGKTDLLLGLASTHHKHSIIFRRVFPSMRGMIERSREIYNVRGETGSDTFNEGTHIWRLCDKRLIEFGTLQYEKDKENYRGRPHDLYGWDEITEFTESQFRFVNAWNRSTRRGQRCRVVATGNPPTTQEGLWIIEYFAPWLKQDYPTPAKPGELRWFARVDDKDVERNNGAPFTYKGETIQPRSRTFIPARLSDNPYLVDSGYGSVLQSLPEPLRSQMLYGDFGISVTDDAYQVIPTAWVRAAQERWKPDGAPKDDNGVPLRMSVMAADIARGGDDKEVIAMRYGTWFAPLVKIPGKKITDGALAVKPMIEALEQAGEAVRTDKVTEYKSSHITLPVIASDIVVRIDVIGIGSSAFDVAVNQGLRAVAVNFGAGSHAFDKSRKLKFANQRAEYWWMMREVLDPTNEDNRDDPVCLPPDQDLLADLCAPRWQPTMKGVKIEEKEDVKQRIGRSPDCGDAVVMAARTSKTMVVF